MFNINLVPLIDEPKFSIKFPQFVETPEILQKKEQVPTGIMGRLGTIWRYLEKSVVEGLKIY